MIRCSKHNSMIHDKQNFTQIRIFFEILLVLLHTKRTLVIGAHYGTIQNTPQTAVVVITGTRNHRTTYNLNHLEINVPRVLQVGGTANARQTFFFLLDTKLTRIDDDVSLKIFPFTLPRPDTCNCGTEQKKIVYRYNNLPITRYTLQL